MRWTSTSQSERVGLRLFRNANDVLIEPNKSTVQPHPMHLHRRRHPHVGPRFAVPAA